MANPFELFEMDDNLETNGVKIEYGEFWFLLARAGGSNERFNQSLKKLFSPYRRALETDSMDPKLADKLTTEAFLDTVLLNWGSEKYGPGKMLGKQGEAIEFSRENAAQLFSALPELLLDLKAQASKAAIFRRSIIEDDAGN